MKKGWKIVLSLLAILILIGGSIVFWQWKNLKMLASAAKYTPEEIEIKLQANKDSLQQTVDQIPEVNVRGVTDEERDALRDGTMTREELIQSLTESLTAPEEDPPQPDDAAGTEENTAPPEEENAPEVQQAPSGNGGEAVSEEDEKQREYEEKLAAILAESYVLREEYGIALDEIEKRAVAEYREFTPEQKKKTSLLSWASGYINEVRELEKECDAKIDALLDELTTLIKDNNGDMSLIDKLAQAYQDEKDLKVSYYMAELRKRGLI